jgi:biopolymer transport protein ExbB/biopolymer transport protein TolQ
MLLRTVSLVGLLSLSTAANAEDPAVAPADAPTAEVPAATPDSTDSVSQENAGENDAADGSATPTEATTNTDATGEDANAPQEETVQEPVQQEPIQEEPVKEASDDEAHAGGHAGSFTVEEMWNQSSGPVRAVLGTLLFMLVAAMGVGLERLITLGSARSQSRKLAEEVGALLNDSKMKEALAVCGREDMSKSYLGHLLSAGLKEFESREDHYGIEAVERAIEKNAITETASLNKGLNILATVGSTAPFVGLVGTIFGIINAFGQIGAEGGADLTTLAPAIGEALITTAFGIIVAIVGVWLFNFFTATIGSITNDMAEASQELVDWCHKRIRPAMKNAE